MKKKIDPLPLREFLKTKNDANDFIYLLEKLSADLFKKNGKSFDKLLSQDLSYEVGKTLKSVAEGTGESMRNKQHVELFFSHLKDITSSLPVIHVIVAVEPTEKVVSLIHNWIYNNFKKLMLLDITYDPELIGGCVVSFNGKANDYSLKSQMSMMRNQDVL